MISTHVSLLSKLFSKAHSRVFHVTAESVFVVVYFWLLQIIIVKLWLSKAMCQWHKNSSFDTNIPPKSKPYKKWFSRWVNYFTNFSNSQFQISKFDNFLIFIERIFKNTVLFCNYLKEYLLIRFNYVLRREFEWYGSMRIWICLPSLNYVASFDNNK